MLLAETNKRFFLFILFTCKFETLVSIYMDNNNFMDFFEGQMDNLYQTIQSDECFFVCWNLWYVNGFTCCIFFIDLYKWLWLWCTYTCRFFKKLFKFYNRNHDLVIRYRISVNRYPRMSSVFRSHILLSWFIAFQRICLIIGYIARRGPLV